MLDILLRSPPPSEFQNELLRVFRLFYVATNEACRGIEGTIEQLLSSQAHAYKGGAAEGPGPRGRF